MSHPASQVCPYCMTAKRMHKLHAYWKCYVCNRTFDKPVAVAVKPKPAGNITPLTYRQQLMREILMANEMARR
jgi:ribosomal protein L37AE/L43A